MSDSKVARDEGPRGFSVLMQTIDEGRLHAEVSEEIQRLAGELNSRAIRYARDASGELTLKIKFKASENGTVVVRGEVKTTLPKLPSTPLVYWLTKGNNLTVDNPRQQKLGLGVVPSQAAPRDLPADAPAPARSV